MRVLNIVSSPRGEGSASIAVADAFLERLRQLHPDVEIDTLNVWAEDLPEFDTVASTAKYKATRSQPLDARESSIWATIESLAGRFAAADRIVLGAPMWNWAYPYKLKQLIDLVTHRGLLFTVDGDTIGPALDIPRALVLLVRGRRTRNGAAGRRSSSTTSRRTSSSG